MKYFKIVLTGGPCAGKTTLLNAIKEDLKKKNITCLTVSEVATELINSGFPPSEWKSVDFQSMVLKRQLLYEDEIANHECNFSKKDGICVVIYDRGIFDSMAYLNDADSFIRLLCGNNLNVISTLDKYDLVLDLLSVATCKPEAYNLNNEARSETPEEARILDEKTSNAWACHRNMKVISSGVSEEKEKKMVLKLVYDFINEKNNSKVKHYLVDLENSNLTAYDNYFKIDVRDTYIDLGFEDCVCKLSERYCCGFSYVFEAYKKISDSQVKVLSETISESMYDELYYNCRHLVDEKGKQFGFIYDKSLCRLSVYDNKAILDVYSNSNNDDIKVPHNIRIIREIDDSEYIIDNKDRNNIECIKKMLKL